MPNKRALNEPNPPVSLAPVDADSDTGALRATPPRRPLPPQATALTLWAVVAVAVTVKILLAPSVHTLFPRYASSARHWVAGQSLYAGDTTAEGTFRYCPTFAVFLIPFNAIGLTAGGVLWSWFNIGVLLYGLRRFTRDVLPGRWPAEREAALLTLTLIAAHRSIWNAQAHVLVCGLILLACSATVRKRYWWAAVLLTVPILFKIAPLAPALLLVALYPRALGPRLAAALLLVSAAAFLTQRPGYVCSQYIEWVHSLSISSARRWPSHRDAWTVWELLAGDINLRAYRLLQLAAAAGVLVACLRYTRLAASGRVHVTITVGLGLGYVMLFGPAVEYPTLALFAPFTAWAVLESLESRFHRPLAIAGYVIAVFLAMGAFQRATQNHLPLTAAALPIGSLLTAVWMLLYARSHRRSGEITPG
jgi:alpha-1,2-mannosyltransferase